MRLHVFCSTFWCLVLHILMGFHAFLFLMRFPYEIACVLQYIFRMRFSFVILCFLAVLSFPHGVYAFLTL
jgi:hypothetical protein